MLKHKNLLNIWEEIGEISASLCKVNVIYKKILKYAFKLVYFEKIVLPGLFSLYCYR